MTFALSAIAGERRSRASLDGRSPSTAPRIHALRVTIVLIPIASRNLLQPGDCHGLVLSLFVPANHLLADTDPSRKFRLRYSPGNSHLRDKWRDLIQSFDVG
jgi:hypothetical protein